MTAFNLPSGPVTIGRMAAVKIAYVAWALNAKRAAGFASAGAVDRERKRERY
jgi:hypothetical protein